jgi:hypothetical protein
MTDVGCRRAVRECGSVGDARLDRRWLTAQSIGHAGPSCMGRGGRCMVCAWLSQWVGLLSLGDGPLGDEYHCPIYIYIMSLCS